MDRFLTLSDLAKKTAKGGARVALPFLLLAAFAPGAAAQMSVTNLANEDPNLDVGLRLLDSKAGALNGPAAAAGFPGAGGAWLLWGGGATITPGLVRIQFAAWEGQRQASAGDRTSAFDLDLVSLTAEQRYPLGSFFATAGASLEAGQLLGSLTDSSQSTNVDAPLLGASVQAGIRWPADTKLGFFARGGWEWLSGDGTWKGDLAPQLGNTRFDLGGPTATLQVELSF